MKDYFKYLWYLHLLNLDNPIYFILSGILFSLVMAMVILSPFIIGIIARW